MRTKRNELLRIQINGTWVDSVDGVKSEIFFHFKNHFDSAHSPRPTLHSSLFLKKLSAADNCFLTMPFMEEEIKKVVWDIDSNCNPGPDGFTFGFFKANWDIIKGEIIQTLQDFHRYIKFVKGFNPSFIYLIPKKESPKKIEDYCLISLIGSTYKILSKILADRLSKVIDSVIADNQSAFIK